MSLLKTSTFKAPEVYEGEQYTGKQLVHVNDYALFRRYLRWMKEHYGARAFKHDVYVYGYKARESLTRRFKIGDVLIAEDRKLTETMADVGWEHRVHGNHLYVRLDTFQEYAFSTDRKFAWKLVKLRSGRHQVLVGGAE